MPAAGLGPDGQVVTARRLQKPCGACGHPTFGWPTWGKSKNCYSCYQIDCFASNGNLRACDHEARAIQERHAQEPAVAE